MKNKSGLYALFILTFVMFITGCVTSASLPVGSYIPTNYIRYDNAVPIEVGPFLNGPLAEGIVNKPNLVKSTAIGSYYLSQDVDEFVRRITALELEKTGFSIRTDENLILTGNIIKLLIEDIGLSVTYEYSIEYIITNRSTGAVVFSKVYTPVPSKGGKFGTAETYSAALQAIVVEGYELFITDPEVRTLLDPPVTLPL